MVLGFPFFLSKLTATSLRSNSDSQGNMSTSTTPYLRNPTQGLAPIQSRRSPDSETHKRGTEWRKVDRIFPEQLSQTTRPL